MCAQDSVEVIEYEQCPYEWEHVSQIYLWMQSPPPEDGAWLEWVSGLGAAVRYRVKDGYFQFFSGDSECELFRELLALEPMITLDDAEWTIEKHGNGEYLVRSVFTRTFGPIAIQGDVHRQLEPLGLFLENKDTCVSGAAIFERLDSKALLEACDRLTVLETIILQANKAVNDYLEQFWNLVSEQIRQEGSAFAAPHRTGPKHREPIK